MFSHEIERAEACGNKIRFHLKPLSQHGRVHTITRGNFADGEAAPAAEACNRGERVHVGGYWWCEGRRLNCSGDAGGVLDD